MSTETRESLLQQKDKAVMGVFWLSLSMVAIFGVPAAAGAVLGSWLDGRFGTGRMLTIVVLGIMLILSWVVVVRWYRSVKRKLDDINKRLQTFNDQH